MQSVRVALHYTSYSPMTPWSGESRTSDDTAGLMNEQVRWNGRTPRLSIGDIAKERGGALLMSLLVGVDVYACALRI